MEEKNKEKIDGYFSRAYDDYKSGDYSSAKDFTDRILNLEPSNKEAILLKKTIFCIKGKNGRYAKTNIFLNESYFSILENWIKEKDYLETSNSMHELINYNLDFMFEKCLDYHTYCPRMDDLHKFIKPLLEVVQCEHSTKLNNFSSYLNQIIEEGNKYNEMLLEQRKKEEIKSKKEEKKKLFTFIGFIMIGILTLIGMVFLIKNIPEQKNTILIISFFVLFVEIALGRYFYKK